MTDDEYRKKTTQLRRAKTMARTALKNHPGPLAEKLIAKRKVKEADEALRVHLRDYFELVPNLNEQPVLQSEQ